MRHLRYWGGQTLASSAPTVDQQAVMPIRRYGLAVRRAAGAARRPGARYALRRQVVATGRLERRAAGTIQRRLSVEASLRRRSASVRGEDGAQERGEDLAVAVD